MRRKLRLKPPLHYAFGFVFAIIIGVFIGTPLWSSVALADEAWPTRSVKFILTLGPGSGADIGARLFAGPVGMDDLVCKGRKRRDKQGVTIFHRPSDILGGNTRSKG